MTDSNLDILTDWIIKAQDGLKQYADSFRAFYSAEPRLGANAEMVIGQLGIRNTLTSDSILFLTMNQKLWDAEVLLRTVLDGTAKLAFICLGTPDEQAARVEQFVEDIPAIERLRQHHRVVAFLASVKNPTEQAWQPLHDLVMAEPALTELSARHPESTQQALTETWATANTFGQLLNSTPSGSAEGALVQYGLASHLIHSDADSVLTMWDREQRSERRRESLELAHAGRICSDVLSFAALRAYSAYRAKGLDDRPLRTIDEQLMPLREAFGDAASAWSAVEHGDEGAGGNRGV